MRAKLISETQLWGSKITKIQRQWTYWRYYFASQFVEGKQVLEVGCGAGIGLSYLAEKSKRVIGGDCVADTLRCAHEHYDGKVELVSLDAHNMPFKDGCVDVVVALEMMHYLPQPNEFINECCRIIRRGGTLILSVPNRSVPGFAKTRAAKLYFSVPELAALLSQCSSVEIFGFLPVPAGRPGFVWRLRHAAGVAYSWAARLLDLVPKGGKKVREVLDRLVLGKAIMRDQEIADEVEGEMIQGFQPVPLPCSSPDLRHRVLYVVAHTQ